MVLAVASQAFWTHALWVTNTSQRVANMTVWRVCRGFVHKTETWRTHECAQYDPQGSSNKNSFALDGVESIDDVWLDGRIVFQGVVRHGSARGRASRKAAARKSMRAGN